MSPKKLKWLAPTGSGVKVDFTRHSLGRLIERFTPYDPGRAVVTAEEFERLDRAEQERVFHEAIQAGLPYQEFVDGVQNPNAGRPDEVSSHAFGARGTTRYCRWFRPVMFAKRTDCQVVLIVESHTTDDSPGSIRIVTVYPPK